MKSLYRILGGALIVYLGVMAVMYLQFLFDRGDIRKASQFLNDFKPGPAHEHSLLEVMATDLGQAPDQIACDSEILSRTEGTVLIHCHGIVAEQKTTRNYEWIINLVSYQVSANNPEASALLAKVESGHEKDQTHRSPDGRR
jgi:hypothetical protein